MFSVNIRAKSSCDILKSVGISRGIGIFFSPIRSIDVPSYVSGRSYSHLGEIAKYRKRALDQIIRYAGYLEQIHAPAEYLEQVNVLQESVSDLTIKTKDLKPFRFRL